MVIELSGEVEFGLTSWVTDFKIGRARSQNRTTQSSITTLLESFLKSQNLVSTSSLFIQ